MCELIPKIELHRHLEGSLRLSTIYELAKRNGLDLPYDDEKRFQEYFQVSETDERTLAQFLTKFIWLRQLLTDRDAISRVTYECVEDAAKDNTKYLEIRFNYSQLARRGFTDEDIIAAISEGVQRGEKDYRIKVGLICGISRELPQEDATKTVEFAIRNQKNGIVGLDLMNDERYEAKLFSSQYKKAKDAGLHLTAHAGEACGPESIISAINDLHVERIGHGSHILDDPLALELAKENNVLVECCLSSNVHTGAVTQLGNHPLLKLKAERVPFNLNTDDPGVSNISLIHEYGVAKEHFAFTKDDFIEMSNDTVNHIFRDDAKEWLRQELKKSI